MFPHVVLVPLPPDETLTSDWKAQTLVSSPEPANIRPDEEVSGETVNLSPSCRVTDPEPRLFVRGQKNKLCGSVEWNNEKKDENGRKAKE